MKHIKTTLALIILLSSSFTLNAEGLSAPARKGMAYSIVDTLKQTVAVIAPSSPAKGSTVLEIPQTIRMGGKSYTVTTIGKNAFKGSGITEVILPDTITEIDDLSFANCLYLKKVVLPKRVNIAKSAFQGCTSLSEISLGSDWTLLDLSPFSGCTALKSISVPARTRIITGLAGLTSLASIDVDSDNQDYSSFNGMLFDKAQETLMFCPSGFDKKIVVPEGTVTVRRGALATCLFTEEVELPSTLKYLDFDEFAGMRNLTSLKFGSNDVINTASFGGKNVLSLEMNRTAKVYVPRKSFNQYAASLSSKSGAYTSLNGRSRKIISEDSLLGEGQLKKYRNRNK